MEVKGYISVSEQGLNNAIMNLEQKLKLPIRWEDSKSPFFHKRTMNEVDELDRLTYVVTLANKLYKR